MVLPHSFVVSEHNGALLEAAKQFDGRIGFTTLQLMKLVIKNAAAITTVSAVLRNGIAKRFAVKGLLLFRMWLTLPYLISGLAAQQIMPETFLHVSTLSAIKMLI